PCAQNNSRLPAVKWNSNRSSPFVDFVVKLSSIPNLANVSINIVTQHVRGKTSHPGIILSLVFAVFLWGGNNTGTKVIVSAWPPIWTGASRFLCAGLLLLALLKWTPWLGATNEVSSGLRKRLWLYGGCSLASYIVCFNWALRF